MSPPIRSQESLKVVPEGTPVRHLTLKNLTRKIPRCCQIFVHRLYNLVHPKCDQNTLGSDADDSGDCRMAVKGKECNFFLGFCIFSHKFFSRHN